MAIADAMIPNTIHFIFGLDPEFGGKPFSFVHYLAVRSAAAVNRPDEIVFHYAFEPAGQWWEAAKPYMTLDRIHPPREVFGRPLDHFAHKADILRIEILWADGGIHLDLDVFCIRPFDPLRSHSVVMGIEPNVGLCNAVLLARRGARFLELWRDAYRDFDGSRWNFHSVVVPYRLAQKNPGLVHVLDEYAFFFPMYDDPMHRWLWCDSISIKERINSAWHDIRRARGRMSKELPVRHLPYLRHALGRRRWYDERLRRSYCIHLWESLWWDRYLRHIEPRTIGSSKGLFFRLVEEVLPDVAFQ